MQCAGISLRCSKLCYPHQLCDRSASTFMANGRTLADNAKIASQPPTREPDEHNAGDE
jgi:hypothetical protein